MIYLPEEWLCATCECVGVTPETSRRCCSGPDEMRERLDTATFDGSLDLTVIRLGIIDAGPSRTMRRAPGRRWKPRPVRECGPALKAPSRSQDLARLPPRRPQRRGRLRSRAHSPGRADNPLRDAPNPGDRPPPWRLTGRHGDGPGGLAAGLVSSVNEAGEGARFEIVRPSRGGMTGWCDAPTAKIAV